MGIVVALLFLAGPLIALGIWLWLRSRREPIMLTEPLDIGRVVSSAFGVFTRQGWPVVILSALLIGVPQIASALVMRVIVATRITPLPTPDPAHPFAGLAVFMTPPLIIGGIVMFLLSMLFYVASTIFLVARYEGAPIAIGEAVSRAPARVLPAFGAIILAGIGITLGWIFFLLPGIVLALSWMVLVPVISCEDAGFFGSFARSRALSLGSRGRILLLLVLLMVVFVILSIPGGALTGAFSGQPQEAPSLFASIWSVVLGTLIGAFDTALFASLYVELRRIRDGMSRPGLAEVFA